MTKIRLNENDIKQIVMETIENIMNQGNQTDNTQLENIINILSGEEIDYDIENDGNYFTLKLYYEDPDFNIDDVEDGTYDDTMEIQIDFDINYSVSEYRPASYYQPAEGGDVEIDNYEFNYLRLIKNDNETVFNISKQRKYWGLLYNKISNYEEYFIDRIENIDDDDWTDLD